MKLYLADSNKTNLIDASQVGVKLRILISFHYFQRVDLDGMVAKFRVPPEMFVDSGGYSAFSKGAEISIDAYAAFLKRWMPHIGVYANLDVIGDAEATLANQKRLEDLGLRPIPVFHTLEDWRYLEYYVERYPYVALGGMVPYMRDWDTVLVPWLVRCFRIAEGKAVFHGFGSTSWNLLKMLPWYSVDSSSWGSGFRYGQVPIFDSKAGNFVKVTFGDRKGVFKHAAIIRAAGLDPLQLIERSRYDRAAVCALSALSYVQAERWLQSHHGDITIPKNAKDDTGMKMYLANSHVRELIWATSLLGGVERE